MFVFSRYNLLSALILMLSSGICSGENLVPNGGFETFSSCPKKTGQISRAEGWSSCNSGTPDYFHACYTKSIDGVGVPNNLFGTYAPHNGNGYAGIFSGEWEHEYIQVGLITPLVAGRNYCVRFWVSSPANLSHDYSSVSFLLADRQLSNPEPGSLPDSFAFFPGPSRTTFPYHNRWTLVYGNYTATGGEQLLVIGYSASPGEKVYTFIDDVAVHEYPKSADCGQAEFTGIVEKDTGNYIPNGSFEYNYGCPERREDLHLVRNWDVGANTPDYYNRCGSENAGVPVNFLGNQEPKSGDAFGGFWVFLSNHQNYREYLQILLKHPLTKGRRYCLSAWFSLADISEFAVDELHAVITPRRPPLLHTLQPDDSAVLVMKSMGYIENKSEWVFLFKDFIAKGDEAYLTIGNFYKDDDPRIRRVDTVQFKADGGRYQNSAYYYVDDVSITEWSIPSCPCRAYLPEQVAEGTSAEPEPPSLEPPGWEKGKTLVLRNIHFDVDQAVILEQSYLFLDTLSQFLKDHPQIRARISGHTDNTGTTTRNLALSRERAAAIVEYLKAAGIDAARLRAEGAGSSLPVADNAAPEGRALNRRVEIAFE